MLQLRGKTGSPHKGDGTLSQSGEETFEGVLARLKTNRCVCVSQPVPRVPSEHSVRLADLFCRHTPVGDAGCASASSEGDHCCRRNLEVWTEHFRLWLAAELLQPLDRLVRRAQKVEAHLSEPCVVLSP